MLPVQLAMEGNASHMFYRANKAFIVWLVVGST